MTRIEKVLAVYKQELLENNCPEGFICGGPIISSKTVIRDEKTQMVLGCRGITCKQCWNAEAKE